MPSPYVDYLNEEIAKLERLIDLCYQKWLERADDASEEMTAKIESMITRNEQKLAAKQYELSELLALGE